MFLKNIFFIRFILVVLSNFEKYMAYCQNVSQFPICRKQVCIFANAASMQRCRTMFFFSCHGSQTGLGISVVTETFEYQSVFVNRWQTRLGVTSICDARHVSNVGI